MNRLSQNLSDSRLQSMAKENSINGGYRARNIRIRQGSDELWKNQACHTQKQEEAAHIRNRRQKRT